MQYITNWHSIISALENNKIKELIVQREREDNRMRKIIDLAKSRQCKLKYLDKKHMDKLCAYQQGVLAELIPTKSLNEKDLEKILSRKSKNETILVLDCITDPHNLGACLRSAEGAGVLCVILPKDKSVNVTEAVLRGACGAIDNLSLVTVTNLARTLEVLKEHGFWLYGMADDASNNIYTTDLTGLTALVLGNENKGIRDLTRKKCDNTIKIPMQGKITSLNVSVATGIALFEVARQNSNI